MAFLVALVGAVGAGTFFLLRRPPESTRIAGPLEREGSVLACPVLEAKAHDFQKTGWIGAAAAQLACERAQILLGSSARTLVPAELAGLMRAPGEGFPFQPYDGDDVRKTQLAAAANADAWLDGSIERKPDGFHVRLVLKRKDAELGVGEADGMMVHEAVRGAMDPLIKSGLIPTLPAKDWREPWMRGASADAELSIHDLHVAVLAENDVLERAECNALRKRSDLGGMRAFVDTLCADRLGERLPAKPEIDRSSTGALVTSASTLRLHELRTDQERAELTGLARELENAAMKEKGDARALIAAAVAEIHYALADRDQSERLALLSIRASPKLVDARGTAWHRLSFTTENGKANLAAHAAWLPWEPFGQGNTTVGAPLGGEEGAARAAALAMRGYWYTAYGELLLHEGKLTAASVVAAVGGSVHLAVELLRAQGQLGKALDTALNALANPPTDHRDVGSPILRLELSAIELAVILERPRDFTDSFVKQFIDPDPPLISKGAVSFFGTAAICLQSPPAVMTRCLKRLETLFFAGHWGAALPGATEILTGALRYVAGDMRGAAKAWRPLAAQHVVVDDMMHEIIVDAFERGGEPDLADRVDTNEVTGEGQRLTLGTARAAMRSEKKGDCAKAREYAQRIVDKWDASDERPPVVERMKKLLGRCR